MIKIIVGVAMLGLVGCSTIDGSVQNGMFCRIGPSWNGAPSTILYSSMQGSLACGDAVLTYTPPVVKP